MSLARTTPVWGRGRRWDKWLEELRWLEADRFIGGAHCKRWWRGYCRKQSVGSRGLKLSGSWCTVWGGEWQSEQTGCLEWLYIRNSPQKSFTSRWCGWRECGLFRIAMAGGRGNTLERLWKKPGQISTMQPDCGRIRHSKLLWAQNGVSHMCLCLQKLWGLVIEFFLII